MKQYEQIGANMKFSNATAAKVTAIVNVFETGKLFGDFGAFAVLDDGAGVSYGINQFTHRSGALHAVVAEYLATGGVVGKQVLEKALPILHRTDGVAINVLAGNLGFKRALKAAAISREMRAAQTSVAHRLYLRPAIDACDEHGLALPLSLAVVYDSINHGSWLRIRDAVLLRCPAAGGSEKDWVTAYVRKRHAWLTGSPRLAKTSYRTKFFLEQIMIGNWGLDLPVCAHGVVISDELLFRRTLNNISNDLAAEPVHTSSNATPAVSGAAHIEKPRESSVTARSQNADAANHHTQPPTNTSAYVGIERIEKQVFESARNYDRVETLVKTVLTRKDAAKSLWTTVAGSVWQIVWAVTGFAYGVPRFIWLSAAILTAAFALIYLYRQITLARIRELAGGK